MPERHRSCSSSANTSGSVSRMPGTSISRALDDPCCPTRNSPASSRIHGMRCAAATLSFLISSGQLAVGHLVPEVPLLLDCQFAIGRDYGVGEGSRLRLRLERFGHGHDLQERSEVIRVARGGSAYRVNSSSAGSTTDPLT